MKRKPTKKDKAFIAKIATLSIGGSGGGGNKGCPVCGKTEPHGHQAKVAVDVTPIMPGNPANN